MQKTGIEIILNYDFDPEQGYTHKSIELDSNEWAIYESMHDNKRKLILYLYEEDIEELLKGTGISINGD